MLNPGKKIQNYKVLSLIGKGGMGAVYKCEDTMLGRVVAIKELNSLLTTDPNFVQRFRQEAQLQAKLTHPNIVSLYAFFEDSGEYYMVMEYLEGQTLKDIIRQKGPVPEARALKILEQSLNALAYAHQKQIIHRDIKPSNIMVGSNDTVKVMDFGIARIMGEAGLTRTGQQLGTVTYMSPEQVMAQKDIDGRSDIYSLGITLFEMLSGRLPYDLSTDSDYQIMDRIVHSVLPDPRSYYPHITDKTIAILNKMLEKEKSKRFASANEIITLIHDRDAMPVSLPSNVSDADQLSDSKSTISNSRQVASGSSVRQNTGSQNRSYYVPQHKVPTYLTQAILVTLFCCLPFGIIAIVNAAKVSNLLANSEYDEAEKCSREAKKWVTISFWLGIGIGILSVIGSIGNSY